MGPRVMLASLFALCAVIELFISNTATAVLMAPIALGTAQQMGSPLSLCHDHRHRGLGGLHDAGLLAGQHPGARPRQLQVRGFQRIGVPFTLLVMVVSVIAIPGSSRSDGIDEKRRPADRLCYCNPDMKGRHQEGAGVSTLCRGEHGCSRQWLGGGCRRGMAGGKKAANAGYKNQPGLVCLVRALMVRKERLELTPGAQNPKSGASTNFATSARIMVAMTGFPNL